MKCLAVLCLFTLTVATAAFSQELPNLKNVKLNRRAHFKDINPIVLKVTDYLFATPIDHKNKSRKEAGQFLIAWMNDTPFETFYLEEKETSFFNTDTELTLMYMAAYTKFSMENKAVTDQKEKILGAMELILPYLDRQEDKSKWSTDLWQLVESSRTGKLKAFLTKKVY